MHMIEVLFMMLQLSICHQSFHCKLPFGFFFLILAWPYCGIKLLGLDVFGWKCFLFLIGNECMLLKIVCFFLYFITFYHKGLKNTYMYVFLVIKNVFDIMTHIHKTKFFFAVGSFSS